MSKRYPRRFKSDSEGCYIELPASDSVGIVVTPHYRQPLEHMTEEWLEENRVETFDHHDEDESGMYRNEHEKQKDSFLRDGGSYGGGELAKHFSAACPSPANSETATLRAEVERLTRELDAYRRAKQENDERYMNERDFSRIEAGRLREAIGLMTTAKPDMEVDPNNPVGMARDVCRYVESLARERDAWMETARQHCKNEFFYKDLITKIGEPFGVEARMSDDGSVQDSVIALKVPELVANMAKENGNQKSELWMLSESIKRLARIKKELTKERDELREKLAESDTDRSHAINILDLCDIPRTYQGDDGKTETYTVLGRMRALETSYKSLRMESQLKRDPCVIDEHRWLEERNAGAEGFARMIMEDDGRGAVSDGPCRDAIEGVRDLRRRLAKKESELATERGRVEGLKEGGEFLKQQVINTEKRLTDALADIDQIGQWLTLPPDLTVERILEEIEYVREKARGSYHDKWKSELQRQLNEAWMRVDYATADRIADLLGVPKPSDHEKAAG